MNQSHMYNLLALIISSIFLLHCATATSSWLNKNYLEAKSDAPVGPVHKVNQVQGKDILMEEGNNGGGSNILTVGKNKELARQKEILMEKRKQFAKAKGILPDKDKQEEAVHKSESGKDHDNIVQKSEPRKGCDDIVQKSDSGEDCDNIVQKDNIIQKKEPTNSDTSSTASESTMDKYLNALEKNVAAFQQVNKNVEEMMKLILDSKTTCDGRNEGDDNTDPTPKTTLPTRKPVIGPGRTPPIMPLDLMMSNKTRSTSTDTVTTASDSNKHIHADKNSTSKPSESDTVYKTYVGKEHEQAELKCDQKKGQKIRIIDAYYGADDVTKCPHARSGPVTHQTGDRTDAIRSLCGSWTQTKCSFPVESSLLGDSCEGAPKILRVTYYCSRPGVIGVRENLSE